VADLTVTWEEKNLSDFVPIPITSMAAMLPSVKSFLQAEADTKNVLIHLQQDPGAAVPDPIYVAIDKALSEVTELRQQLQNNQLSILPIPIIDNGLLGISRFLLANLGNTRDSRRPTVDTDGYVAGFGLLLPGPDVSTAKLLHQQVTDAFLTADHIRRAALRDKYPKSSDFELPTVANRLARTAAPIPASPWVSMKLSDIIPGALDMLYRVEGLLNSISSHKAVSQLSGFSDFVTRSTSGIAATIDAVSMVIRAIEQAFQPAELKVFKFPAQQGGVDALISSIGSWMDRNIHPEVVDITTNTLVTGVFVVWGGSVQAPVDALYGLVNDLMLP
jgi:hypothetical protein